MSYTPNRDDLNRLESELACAVGTHETVQVADAVAARIDPELAEELNVEIRTAVTNAIIAQHKRITQAERSERR